MRIGFVELVLLLFIASITVGPNAALFVDRWLRRAQRTSAAAARRKAQLEAQAAIEREALMTRFRVASNIFALLMLAALAYGLLLRPIDTPPKAYTAPDVRQDTGAAQTALSTDSKDGWKPGGYLGVDCVRTRDGLVYAAAYNGAAMKKRQSDLVRTDGGHTAAILSVEGELTGFAFDADGDLWLTVVTSSGGALCRAKSTAHRWVCCRQWRPARTGRSISPCPPKPLRKTGWKALSAPSSSPTPARAASMCMTRRPGRWNRCWAAWPVRLVWPSRRMAEHCTFLTSGIAASGVWTPTPGS